MGNIDKHLANQGRSTTTTPPGATNSSINQQTIQLVNKIFDRLRAIYPAWKQAIPTTAAEQAAKKEWLGGLMDAGISDYSLIEAGLNACRGSGSPFWPTVGQFIGFCNKAACDQMGALETMEAYRHLLGYYTVPTQSRDVCDLNPIVYHLVSDQGFDVFAFREMSSEKAVKYFSNQYRSVLKYLVAGGEMRRPVQVDMRIDNPSGVTHRGRTSKETAKKNIAAMRQMLKS